MKLVSSIFILVLFIEAISCSVQSSLTGLVLLKNEELKCKMFKKCRFDVLIRSGISLDLLSINSSDQGVFKFNRISLCSGPKCSSKKDFGSLSQNNSMDYQIYQVEIQSVLIGKATLDFNSLDQIRINSCHITITQPRRVIDIVFDIMIYTFGLMISLLMGILLDKKCILNIFKIPKAMFIGFFCQYLLMPLLAFSICKIFGLTPIESLALFIYGCSPGGAGSNNWTILFGGDLDLSAVLTFVSVLSSMFMMPFWVYTLGSVFSTEANIQIPILGLFGNLMITIVPCITGLILNIRYPKMKKFALKVAKPFTLCVLLTFLILAFVTKFYSFQLLKLRHWISGPLIPWFGYFVGGFTAWVLRLPFNQVKTVAIETGVQNIGVAFLIIYTNLPSPEADFAALPIMSVAFLTNIPLYFLLIIMKIYKHFSQDDEDEKNPQEKNIESGHEIDPMIAQNKN